MKKAVIQTGGKQYLVAEGEELTIELLKSTNKTAEFEPLLILDDDKIQLGMPLLDKLKVVVDILDADVQSNKVTSIRFKAKKRVHKVRGHRQRLTRIKVTKIA
jgi:large subunit ribosomal protein L21